MIKPGNLALKFLLELAAFAAFAVWGADAGSGVAAVVLAVAAPLVAILLWGRFAALVALNAVGLTAFDQWEG